jgi:maltose O-acetyltransferase
MLLKKKISYYFVNLLAANINNQKIRYKIYKTFGIKTKTYNIANGCKFVDGWENIYIGENVLINYGCLFNGYATIEIEDNCAIGCEVALITVSHEQGNTERRAGKPVAGPIKIGKGCWIGARSIILPNVSIGEGCIIAAGSVVTKNCEANGLYAGIPARRIKDLY